MWYLHRVVIICGCAAKHAGPTRSKTRGCSKQTHFGPESRATEGSRQWEAGGAREPATPLGRGGDKGHVTGTLTPRDWGPLTPAEEIALITAETLRMRP